MHLIFDLDGVLIDSVNFHKDSFIGAWNSLNPEFHLTSEFHTTHFGSRSTKQKLEICKTHFPAANFDDVNAKKQSIFNRLLEVQTVSKSSRDALLWAKSEGHTISVCSNSLRQTVEYSLLKYFDDLTFFTVIITGDDITNHKPHPEIYLTALKILQTTPESVLIFEDSDVGITAAREAKCDVVKVNVPEDITIDFLKQKIESYQK